MKRGVYLVLILLLVTIVSAEELAYEGWIYNNKFLVFNNLDYRILISNNGNTALLTSNAVAETLDRGSCFSEDYTKFCFNISSYDQDLQDYKAYFYIYNLVPDLELTRTVDDTILSLGEEGEFTVLIENEGDVDAVDVIYTEDFPNNVEIVDVDNAKIVGKSVIWEGMIEQGESEEISYTIKSVGVFDQYIKASLKYFDGFEQQEEFSEEIRIYSSNILDIDFSTNKEDYELGEPIELEISIENLADYDINMDDFTIYIPEDIHVEDYPSSFEKSGNELTWDGKIDENETKEFEFILSAEKSGKFFVTGDFEFRYRSQEYQINNQKVGFLAHNKGIELTSSIGASERVKSNQLYKMFLRVKNENSFSKIRDIKLRTITDIASIEDRHYGSLDINESTLLLNTELKIPYVEKDTSYKLSFNVSYTTEDNKKYSEVIEKTIAVKAIKTLKLTPNIGDSEIQEEKETTISVTINNPTEDDLTGIYINAIIPRDFSVRGPTGAYADINSSKTVNVFEFKIKPSLVKEDTTYNLTFTADYLFEDVEYSLNEVKQITVKRKTPDVSITRTLSQNSAYLGEVIDISYTIANLDTNVITDLNLQTAQTQYFDTLGMYEYHLDKLDPGEKVTFQGERIRIKSEDTVETGKAVLYFKDKHSRLFNINSSTKKVTGKEADLNGAAIIIQHTLDKEIIAPGESTMLIINITNIGSKIARGNLSEYGYLSIKPFFNTILTKNYTYSKKDTHKIPLSVYYYNFQNEEARAYSNEITVRVKDKEVVIKERKEAAKEKEETKQQEIIQEKQGFFQELMIWFKKLFIKS